MSDGSHSDSGSESDDLSTTGLIATRTKRATAGNLYATLRANLDDEELQKELLAEDEGDAGDYEGSDKDDGDDDEAFESSSDEEDAGPPREGAAEDLEGEKALKKQERAEARKKRKVHEARLKLPAWRKTTKRVKLADDVKAEDGSATERPKKKSERSNWLPTAAEMPMRQSARSLAVANREVVHANLKQSAARSEKQKRIMKSAAQRERSERYMTLTQEERLKKCERIERETAREFGRWEREEAERQRLREEALAAKRKGGFDGPMIRQWSGSVLWVGERIKVGRVEHGSQKVEEIKEEKEEETTETEGQKDDGSVPGMTTPAVDNTATASSGTPAQTHTKSTPEPAPASTTTLPTSMDVTPAQTTPAGPTLAATTSADTQASWLQGIQEYAAQPTSAHSQPLGTVSYTPSTPALNAAIQPQPLHATNPPQHHLYHTWQPSAFHSFTAAQQPSIPPPPPMPLIREQAQRTLLILSSFPSLENPTTTATKRIPKSKLPETTPLDPSPLTETLLPSAHPPFNQTERTYLLTRPRRRTVPGSTTISLSGAPQQPKFEVPLPPAPPKLRCALTSWPAKFKDPKTGLAYADMHQYKAIQRVVAGGGAWSGILGAWVGPSYGLMGRPARGVPEGFAGPKKEVVAK